MSIKLKDTIYDLINNSDKLDGKDSSAFSLTSHTHSEYLVELPQHTHNYTSTIKIGSNNYNVSGNIITLPDYPISLKNPNSLTIQLNGVSLGSYDGSAAKTINITSSAVTGNYLPLTGGTLTGALHINPNSTDSLIIGNGIGQIRLQNTGIEENEYSSIYTYQRGQLIFTDASISSLKFIQYGVNTFRTVYHSGNLTKLSQLTNDLGFITGSYLPLSGGNMAGDIIFLSTNNTPSKGICFKTPNNKYLYAKSDELYFGIDGNTTGKIWHSANDGNGSGLDADTVDGKHASEFSLSGHTHNYAGSSSVGGAATSSIKLQTSRKLWGQSFNGTADVNGNMTINVTSANAISINTSSVTGSYVDFIKCINSGMSATNHTAHITFGYNYSQYNIGYIGFKFVAENSSNNLVTLGLHSVDNILNLTGNSRVGINTTTPSYPLHVFGNICSTDTVIGLQLTASGSSSLMPNINWFNGSGDGYHVSYRLNNEDEDNNYPLKYYYKTGTTYTPILSINKIGLVKSASDFQGNAFVSINWNNSTSASVTNFLNNTSYFRVSPNHNVLTNSIQNIVSWKNTISNIGYTTRYSIGSYRSTSGWGNMIFMVGNNDNGSTKGIELSLGGNGDARLDATNFAISSTYIFNIKAHSSGFDISSTANLAPHYITNFAIYKGSPGAGETVMFCDSNKRVGILTASPGYSLHVNGSCNVSTFYIGGEQITFTT